MSKKDYPYLAYSEFTGHVYVILSKNKKVDVTNQYKFITREKDGIDKLNTDLKNAYAEIKRLKEENAKLQKKNNLEAIKDFWSKLKTHKRKMQGSDWSGDFWDAAILVSVGDDLVREMEKENNG